MEIADLPPLAPPDCSWQFWGTTPPPSGKMVRYRTAYYQMLGYMTQLGEWMGLDGQPEELPVKWWRALD